MNKGPYDAGLAGQVGILSFILRAVGVNERAPNPTGKMQTHSTNYLYGFLEYFIGITHYTLQNTVTLLSYAFLSSEGNNPNISMDGNVRLRDVSNVSSDQGREKTSTSWSYYFLGQTCRGRTGFP